MTSDEAKKILEIINDLNVSLNDLLGADSVLSDDQDRKRFRKKSAELTLHIYSEFEIPIYQEFPELAPKDQ